MKRKIFTIVLLILPSFIIWSQPIHLGRFYTSRNPTSRDTLFLPIDREYVIEVIVMREVDSIKEIDNNEYRCCLYGSYHNAYSKELEILQSHPEDWSFYNYIVESYKDITPIIIHSDTSFLGDHLQKPIDMIYYDTTMIRGLCHESFQTSNQTLIGEILLHYTPLIKFCMLDKISKETTLISELSGNLLIDCIYVVLSPDKDCIHYFNNGFSPIRIDSNEYR